MKKHTFSLEPCHSQYTFAEQIKLNKGTTQFCVQTLNSQTDYKCKRVNYTELRRQFQRLSARQTKAIYLTQAFYVG